jgi:hypothetical protein
VRRVHERTELPEARAPGASGREARDAPGLGEDVQGAVAELEASAVVLEDL